MRWAGLLALALAACAATEDGGADECGDGEIGGAEECDDGNASGGDGCSATCLTEVAERPVCGNAVLEAAEDCDDGNAVAGDGCDPSCAAEQPMACGNGVRERGEGCDDGNRDGGDGCDASCAVEAPSGLCTAAVGLGCDSFDFGDTRGRAARRDVSGYSCATWNESGPEIGYVFVAPGDVEVEVSIETEAELDIFVIEGEGGCAPERCLAHGDDRLAFSARAGALYYLVVDGYLGDAGRYRLRLSCSGGCGDGIRAADEDCDDGNREDGDGCSSECVTELPEPAPEPEL